MDKSAVKFAFVVLSVSLLLSIGFFIQEYNENNILKEVMLADAGWNDAATINMEAGNYYNEASLSYTNKDWDNVVKECESARDEYSKASQELREVKARLTTSKLKHNLIDLYKNAMIYSIAYSENMYEACEHFEEAARYYKIYYAEDTPYEDPSFEMGGKSINQMNEKINSHDDNIRKFNDVLAEIKIEIEGMLN